MSEYLAIADDEYQQRRHARELATWINAKFRDLEAGGRLEEQFFERKGRNVKRLIEEAVPLSRLGLSLWKPGDEPYVTLLPENVKYDGLLEVDGFSARSFKVEVTTIETDQSTLRRQMLSREGTVTLTGPIRRRPDGSIEDGMEGVDVSEQQEAIAALAFSRLTAKTDARSYDENTALLVYLNDFWPLPEEGRLSLHRRTEQYLWERQEIFAVCYCFSPDLTVDWIEVGRRKPGLPRAA